MTREEQLRLEEMKRQTKELRGLANAVRQLDGTIQMYMAYALGLTEDEDEEEDLHPTSSPLHDEQLLK